MIVKAPVVYESGKSEQSTCEWHELIPLINLENFFSGTQRPNYVDHPITRSATPIRHNGLSQVSIQRAVRATGVKSITATVRERILFADLNIVLNTPIIIAVPGSISSF